jgi:hypothetical protein
MAIRLDVNEIKVRLADLQTRIRCSSSNRSATSNASEEHAISKDQIELEFKQIELDLKSIDDELSRKEVCVKKAIARSLIIGEIPLLLVCSLREKEEEEKEEEEEKLLSRPFHHSCASTSDDINMESTIAKSSATIDDLDYLYII